MLRTAALLALFSGSAAIADVTISFEESAPKDRFVLSHDGACSLGPLDVVIDLGGSAGRLIFDTTATGAGVEVFQPFEIVAGGDRVVSAEPVGDGDTEVRLSLSGLEPEDVVAFTIDVDDRLEAGELGQIRVTGGEIAGATARAISAGVATEAAFGANSSARLETAGCLS